MKRAFVLVLFVIVGSGCTNSDTSPAPVATPTRIISIEGDLNFGSVPLRQARNAGFTVANNGNSLLTISGFVGPCATSGMFMFSWRSGTIEPGAAQAVIVTFTPTVPVNCSGTVAVRGDQTGGGDTIPITAVGVP